MVSDVVARRTEDSSRNRCYFGLLPRLPPYSSPPPTPSTLCEHERLEDPPPHAEGVLCCYYIPAIPFSPPPLSPILPPLPPSPSLFSTSFCSPFIPFLHLLFPFPFLSLSVRPTFGRDAFVICFIYFSFRCSVFRCISFFRVLSGYLVIGRFSPTASCLRPTPSPGHLLRQMVTRSRRPG